MKEPCGTIHIKRLRNVFQTVLILGGMLTLFGVLGYMLMGKMGILWTVSLGMILMVTTPKIPPRIFLQRQGAVLLNSEEAEGLYAILENLSRRAEILKTPKLYCISSEVMNAFSMGQKNDAAIVVTDSLIRNLDWREMTGILAHEVAHIRNNDLFLHALADAMTKVTSLLSTFGQILLLIYLPLLIFSEAFISPVVLLLLLFAPTISSLLQLALSRAREFEADQTAAHLTGDPKSLASALKKMEQHEKSFWEKVFMPRRRTLSPSVLRTHPHTEQRVARLLEMARELESGAAECMDVSQFFSDLFSAEGRSRNWHWLKSWFSPDH